MKSFLRACLGAVTFCAAGGASGYAATAQTVIDCPLRDAPFTVDSQLIDILLNPAAKGVVERELGRPLSGGPKNLIGTEAPTFSAIISLRDGGGLFRQSPEKIAKLDVALRSLQVSAADRVAWCAR